MSSQKSQIETAVAPGKIILFGEHAVVYGRPAIAAPVSQVRAEATVERSETSGLEIEAADLSRRYDLYDAPADDPIAAIIRLTCARLGVAPQGLRVRVSSTIPMAGGLGSGAAVSVAIARALGRYFATEDTEPALSGVEGNTEKTKENSAPPVSSVVELSNQDISVPPVSSVAELSNQDISALAYEVEKLHHGTPSGIDNTVIAFERPVYFVKGQPIEFCRVAQPFALAIADTGIAAPTKSVVGDVRRAWEAAPQKYEELFDRVGMIAQMGRTAIEQGMLGALGTLMKMNQTCLRELQVSSPEIERLVEAATAAGAWGAKVSGAGRGGNVIALVDKVTQDKVSRAMLGAGAQRVIVTEIKDPAGA